MTGGSKCEFRATDRTICSRFTGRISQYGPDYIQVRLMFVLISVVIAMWMLLNEQREHKPKSFLRFNEINIEAKRKWKMSSK